ncbi:hypothetical protein C8Q77DRAFT_1132904 [Trametes polyzona]|nr:hypothetical protein C8Q77DRAFT_1132904 [Trametes polyzona]
MSYYPILPIPSWEDPQLSSTPGVVALRPITEPFYLVPHSTLCGLLRDRVPTALPPHAASSQSQSLPESAALVHYSDDAFATANASSSEFSSQPVSEALMPIYSAVHSATVGAYGGPQPSSAISVPSYPYALPDTMAPYTSPLFPVGPPSMHLAEPSPFSPLTLPMPSTHTTDASLSSSRFSDAPGAALAPDTPERPRRLEAPAGHLPSIRAPAVGRDVSVPCSIFNSQPLGALSATSSQPGIKARHGHTTGYVSHTRSRLSVCLIQRVARYTARVHMRRYRGGPQA